MTELLPIDLSVALPCHRCGYDVRAQPGDGVCPECRTPVAESQRLAAIPLRPAWRESDPRWRRRMLAGVWVLVLVPAMAVMDRYGVAQVIATPTFYRVQGEQFLYDTYLRMVFAYLMFCIGVVLLFSKERNRRPGPLDGTRRWGVVASYGVALLGIPEYACITALVVIGIAAMFLSIPPRYQPAVTDLLAKIGADYMFYGPYPGQLADAALVGVSSIVVLLACVPLFNALRSCGPKVAAAILLAPLALPAVLQLVGAIFYEISASSRPPDWITGRLFFFDPKLFAASFDDLRTLSLSRDVLVEALKWLACLATAIWLSVAQLAAIGRRRGKSSAAKST